MGRGKVVFRSWVACKYLELIFASLANHRPVLIRILNSLAANVGEMCIFITYYSGGQVRGQNLSASNTFMCT